MQKQTALKTILGLSLAGTLFSGYLSFSELVLKKCALENVFGTCSNVFHVPACVYGFVMFLLVFIFSIVGIRAEN